MALDKLSREEIARVEVGTTEIDPRLSLILTSIFVMFIVFVPSLQYIFDQQAGEKIFIPVAGIERSGDSTLISDVQQGNNNVLQNIDLLETALEEQSFLRSFFLPLLQETLLIFFDQGNEKVVAADGGRLYYRQGVDHLIGPPFLDKNQLTARQNGHDIWKTELQPDPVAAIVDFKEQLAQRDIELVVMPMPIKAAIQPGHLSSITSGTMLANRSLATFYEILEKNGIHVFDVRKSLGKYSNENGDAFLTTDTHWTPETMEIVAQELTDFLVHLDPQLAGAELFSTNDTEIVGVGDISKMLTLPEGNSLFSGQQVTVSQVVTADNELWQPDIDGEVLLLGDSFTNIYSSPGLGWGFGGGFAEHLSLNLGQSVDLLARNDSGAYVTREMLSLELQRGRDRLFGKKVVVWEFAERELSFGDWKLLDLKLGEQRESDFYLVPTGEEKLVTGVVRALSRSPRPGSVPYRDNIVTIHLVDLKSNGQLISMDQTLVYGWGMRDNQLTELAAVRPGDEVSLVLSSWEEKEGEYGSFRRTPLEDEMLELELPNWGKIKND